MGKTYYDFRAELMVRNNEGLTKTYNRFHDPDERSPAILKLRELHAAMDRAVLDAYGWTDLNPTCEFLLDYEEDEDEDDPGGGRRRKKPWRYRWPDYFRDEVLARLLELNRQRAEEERLSGAAAEAGKSKSTRKQVDGGRQPRRSPIRRNCSRRNVPTRAPDTARPRRLTRPVGSEVRRLASIPVRLPASSPEEYVFLRTVASSQTHWAERFTFDRVLAILFFLLTWRSAGIFW